MNVTPVHTAYHIRFTTTPVQPYSESAHHTLLRRTYTVRISGRLPGRLPVGQKHADAPAFSQRGMVRTSVPLLKRVLAFMPSGYCDSNFGSSCACAPAGRPRARRAGHMRSHACSPAARHTWRGGTERLRSSRLARCCNQYYLGDAGPCARAFYRAVRTTSEPAALRDIARSRAVQCRLTSPTQG